MVAFRDSAAALSALVLTAPRDLITPSSVQTWANSFDTYCAPLSLWKTAPRRPSALRAAAASLSASVTSSVRMWSAIDQPASRFEHRSSTELPDRGTGRLRSGDR